MKKLLIFMLMAIVNFSVAGQFSVSAVNSQQPNNWTYVSQDNAFQINFGDKNYLFLGYEQINICPWYCGVTYDSVGIGGGTHVDFEKFRLFAQGGFYYIKNRTGYVKEDENLYYYMIGRFNGMKHKDFTGYRADNGNGIGGAVGVDIPFSKSIGMKVYYRHLQFWNNYVAYLDGGYWHDPATVKLNGYGMGLYYDF